MGELLRFAGYQAFFLGADESPHQGVGRVSPRLVFVDADHPMALSEELRRTAAVAGARLVLFSGARGERDLMQLARRHQVAAFPLPNGPRALERTIDELLNHSEPGFSGPAEEGEAPLRS
jgi:hypothetical protein